MIYGSVCSGIEAASVAWHPLGWRPAFFSEIEAFPKAVLAHRWPGVPDLGDFTQIGAEHGPVDVLVGGTPCQSFSVAGLRKGMADARGNLALGFLRLAARLDARWVVWENVPGVLSSNGGRDFGAFLGGLAELGYGFAYRVLDAQLYGVAQRRRRVFVVGHAGGLWQRAAAVLFERACLRGDPAPRREKGQGSPSRAGVRAAVSSGNGWWDEGDAAGTLSDASEDGTGRGTPLIPAIAGTLGAKKDGGWRGDLDLGCGTLGVAQAFNNTGDGAGTMGGGMEVAPPQRVAQTMAVAHTLRGGGFDASEDGTGRGTPIVPTAMAVRRLTPRECERLQGFPDDYTAIPGAKDGPRYRAIGNSMAVPVMGWIGRRIQMVEDALRAKEAA